MTLFELLHQSAVAGMVLQDPVTGSMPGGHNGPYRDPERPARNTSHWILTFLKGFEISGDMRLRVAAHRAVEYLVSRESRPHGKTFWHRTKEGKDSCNGLIGQAWTIEAMLAGADILEVEELTRLSEEVFLLHPFDEQLAIWNRVEIDGAILDFDMTFNHQLWFAAAGSLLAARGCKEVHRRVSSFLDRINEHLDVFPNGLIWHGLVVKDGLGKRISEQIQRAKHHFKPRSLIRYKSVGYHAFNLYGLALLHQQFPRHGFWDSGKFRRIWRYANSPAFRKALDSNKYGFPYNPPGIEMAFALEVFEGREGRKLQEEWLSEQVRRCYDPVTKMMSLGAADPATHAARLYEATRLPDMQITVSSGS